LDPILVYGATGYTAGLLLDVALKRGMRPVLAGRDRARVAALAARLGLDFRIADLSELSQLGDALRGIRVVLNAAGPFAHTADPMIRACLQAGSHYLDISGELDALEIAAGHDAAARARGIMILPGVGFDVVPSDCLCAHVWRRTARPAVLRIAVSGLELMSPGSSATLISELGRATRVRSAGQLREIPPGSSIRWFDFGNGSRPCGAVSWGDLTTARYTTGIENIETYFELTPAVSAMLQSSRYGSWLFRLPGVRESLAQQARAWAPEPTASERASRRAAIVAEIEETDGRRSVSRLLTPEAYTMTAQLGVEVARRVLRGDVEAGFQTPGRLFGPRFILGFDNVGLTDVQ
jgi:short subunit dehydrogenase-like uncharacterized protein